MVDLLNAKTKYVYGLHKSLDVSSLANETFRNIQNSAAAIVEPSPETRRRGVGNSVLLMLVDPSLRTRPRHAGNSMLPAARFGPSGRQTLGVLSPPANHAVDAHCNRSATFQSSVEHRAEITTCVFKHSSRKRPLKLSLTAFSTGFPGRMKSSFTPCS